MRLLIVILLVTPLLTSAQRPVDYFNKAANQYIDGSKEKALSTLDDGLIKHPNDPNLERLKEALLSEEEQEQDKENNQSNSQGEQDDKKQDDQEQQEQEQNQEQQNQDQENQEDQEKSQEQMTQEKLEEMGISEEKARQLLEAMRQSEIKYLQHQRRKPTKRPPSGKPDW
ncbi:hypothetical protein [Ekhidna sp.]